MIKLSYEELSDLEESWHPIIAWCFRNKVPGAAHKARLILSTIVSFAGWDDDEFYQAVMRRMDARRAIMEKKSNE